MSSLNESKKRDFIAQLIVMIDKNAQLLIDEGFDPKAKVAELKADEKLAIKGEADQKDALAAAKDATKKANAMLDAAYKNGSATVDLITGLLGKDNNLVLEIKKLRK